MPLSFAADIRPLFRDEDVAAMRTFGPFDLSKHQDVVANADEIAKEVEAGDMPCDGCWPQDHISIFKQWITEGMAP